MSSGFMPEWTQLWIASKGAVMGGSKGASRTFAEVFRQALTDRGMPLSGLHRALNEHGVPVALSTLSYWRSAARQPDAAKQAHVIAAAEAVLGLDEGTLLSLAARPWTVRSPVDALSDFEDIDDEGAALVSEAMRALNIVPTKHLRELSQVMITDVGIDGYPRRSTVRTLMQCVEGTIDRIMWAVPMQGGGADAVRLTVVHGIDGGHWQDPGNRLTAVAVEFDPPLRAGETTMLEVRSDYFEGVETQMHIGIFENRRGQKTVNWVRFHPDAVPDWFLEVEATPEGETKRLRGLDTATSIHQARWDFGPGSINLYWGYGEPPDPWHSELRP